MTKTKLEIIGPYTPEHAGPFCTRDGKPVRLISKTDGGEEYPVVGIQIGSPYVACWCDNGRYALGCASNANDLMNAREVPVAREFWINDYGNRLRTVYDTEAAAVDGKGVKEGRTIHVREVLPGDGE